MGRDPSKTRANMVTSAQRKFDKMDYGDIGILVIVPGPKQAKIRIAATTMPNNHMVEVLQTLQSLHPNETRFQKAILEYQNRAQQQQQRSAGR